MRGKAMLQLLDLARENAELKKDLERVRKEAEALRLFLTARDDWAPAANQSSGSVPPLGPSGALM